MEAKLAVNPETDTERLSIFRGGGKPLEEWLVTRFFGPLDNLQQQPRTEDSASILRKVRDELKIAELVSDPFKGVMQAANVLAFLRDVQEGKKIGESTQ